MVSSKGTVFFYFRGKVDAHSLTQILEHLYFFFPKWWEKKIQLYFFISQEKFTFHSLNFSGGAYIKNKEESYIFSEMPFLTPFYVVFFFPRSVFFFPCIFFSWKSLRLTHSLISNVCIFLFPVSEKKKYSVFTHSLDLVKNITKINFSREIKKYGTFDNTQC